MVRNARIFSLLVTNSISLVQLLKLYNTLRAKLLQGQRQSTPSCVVVESESGRAPGGATLGRGCQLWGGCLSGKGGYTAH